MKRRTWWIVIDGAISDTYSVCDSKASALRKMAELSESAMRDGREIHEICLDLYEAKLEGEYYPEMSAVKMKRLEDEGN